MFRLPSGCITVPVLAVYFCPSSVRVVATFSGTVLFPLLEIQCIYSKLSSLAQTVAKM